MTANRLHELRERCNRVQALEAYRANLPTS